ncbi:EamA family transporter [Chloracidobacterium aggregatum]|jgi:drug/metabolite transporter (DMT)-like permease|uniref:EamA family transporter n=1 Tax=Chloracidobacterium sp. N TaxID=2821540 RepID=A0ABX8B7E0_9BACT|nr:EamA family transporter [Chloracidobacterium aggregatum]QUV86591.1 EamA family transporter [Chloracidobacterium sp. 2]QUV88978.1 EamA family transporter [Chloracidobacterium sp. S]QUV95489.1 EamA family transporter [Chloracidobacterium sp. N]QUV98711.1 EamA family transporter [Chloracidobacterium sp. E]QUW01234.1 EamA family transporter [Chloracidobacterium sp. MS 40/45]
MKLHPFVAASVIVNSLGNVLLTLAMKRLAPTLEAHLAAYDVGAVLLTLATDVTFLGGLALLIAFFILFLTLLSKLDLSYVLPVTSLGYVITALLGALLLRETVSALRWTGIAAIAIGVYLVTRSAEADRRTSRLEATL